MPCKRDLTPGMFLIKTNEAKISNSFLNATFNDLPDDPVGVNKIPFNPTLFLFNDSTASATPVPLSKPETSTVSHSMGTFSDLKMVLTESVISLPIPSPGMRVTVYLPPYFLGNTASGDANVAKLRTDDLKLVEIRGWETPSSEMQEKHFLKRVHNCIVGYEATRLSLFNCFAR
ncbi:conserved hypothetical protein [Meyerozyma guilliermondii ATCC 6260]|uniref:Uncharacterized protein n=1 Tax=Meyerozyma guilliermondii (strain ATCC 6260 / CBS 566 / DSM 6381 / JCM 1539 / NBRC 10279 / NRRL Y-324) TaxID=294746 RepID=A5DIP7_PICGU|nr:uncharacterized protein PGUG_03148 [Meyerozyma guilliermondii ATCC 6260]EDK39050.2 conserved hypothetical protein [Meyerozyma guilliermondii ATCC 6260]